MDIETRVRRRRDGSRREGLIDLEALSPVAHVPEPSGRGPTLERLLDHLDPALDGRLPPNAYVYGPFGAGKSAVVRALFDHLAGLSTATGGVVQTTTRGQTPPVPSFVTVDTRTADSEFAFYHAVADGLTDEDVPEHGVGTTALRERVHDRLADADVGVVVAVDHVGEPGSLSADRLVELFAGLPSTVSWLAVGRDPPSEVALTEYTARSIQIDRYGRQALVDVLTARADDGTGRRVLAYDHARRIAEWADGNAHHALAAAFVAADRAQTDDRATVSEADVTAALRSVPRASVSVGRVLALPANRRRVVAAVADLPPDDRTSVSAATDAVVADPAVDLSATTVRRVLYELAEVGILERVQTEATPGKGRPPSRVEVRFPAAVVRRLLGRA